MPVWRVLKTIFLHKFRYTEVVALGDNRTKSLTPVGAGAVHPIDKSGKIPSSHRAE